ncbi:MAG: DsbE family thiol:disulfide interchange protein [Rhizobiaceae bacterium]|nr:DsbE family thiol:disulfide interchange protein [Rhizobiaceae bacterium]
MNEAAGPSKARRILIAAIPLALFAALAAIFLSQLLSGKDTSIIPSALIGKPAPTLALAPLEGAIRAGQPVPALDTAAIRGKLTLVNVWASWCVPCRQEHPIILGLAQDPRLNVVGINYKDKNDAALAFLGELGNPFRAIGVDPRGAAAIDWGVYGIPESFLVAPDGTILFKQVGPFTDDAVRNKLLPRIEEALGGKI